MMLAGEIARTTKPDARSRTCDRIRCGATRRLDLLAAVEHDPLVAAAIRKGTRDVALDFDDAIYFLK